MDVDKLTEKAMALIGEERFAELMALIVKVSNEVSDQLPSASGGESCAESLLDIHDIAEAELRQHFALSPVALTHPPPEQPRRALGFTKNSTQASSHTFP